MEVTDTPTPISSEAEIPSMPVVKTQTHSRNILISLLITALFLGMSAAIAYLYTQNLELSRKISSSIPLASPSPTPAVQMSSSPFSDWQTYQNSERGIEFKYPKNIVISEKTFDEGLIVSGKSDKNVFAFTFYSKPATPLQNPTEKDSTILVNGEKALLQNCPTGCEEDGATPEVQVFLYGVNRSTFVFFETPPLSDESRAILSTVKITTPAGSGL